MFSIGKSRGNNGDSRSTTTRIGRECYRTIKRICERISIHMLNTRQFHGTNGVATFAKPNKLRTFLIRRFNREASPTRQVNKVSPATDYTCSAQKPNHDYGNYFGERKLRKSLGCNSRYGRLALCSPDTRRIF